MYAFLRRPAWIVSHVLIGLLVLVLIGLGVWQQQRWIEERDKVDAVEARAALDPVDYEELVDPQLAPAAIDEDLRFSRVQLTGRYDVDAEVAVLNRSQGGIPGAWVLTPLVRDDGVAVPVIRGWIPYEPTVTSPPFLDAAPPTGEVTVTGTLQLTQERGSFGGVDPEVGTLESLARVDVSRFEQQLPYELGPAWVVLEGQTPPQPGPLPDRVDLAASDPSQNFSYMVQWWLFAAIAAAGYPLVLRSVARHRLRDREDPDDPDAPLDAQLPREPAHSS